MGNHLPLIPCLRLQAGRVYPADQAFRKRILSMPYLLLGDCFPQIYFIVFNLQATAKRKRQPDILFVYANGVFLPAAPAAV